MYVSRIQGAAAFAAPVVQRIINVSQNLMPGPGRPRARTTDLGVGWASPPKSISVEGKTISVGMLQGSTKTGAPFTKFVASLPLLQDGMHPALVTLENGQKVRVTLSVHSTH